MLIEAHATQAVNQVWIECQQNIDTDVVSIEMSIAGRSRVLISIHLLHPIQFTSSPDLMNYAQF